MKKISILCVSCLLILSGCASKVDRLDEKASVKEYLNEVQDLEMQNIQDDTALFAVIITDYFKEQDLLEEAQDISEEERAKISSLNFLKYMENVYKVSSNRVSEDLGGLTVTSQGYVEYIAMLQFYVETFNENREYLETHTVADDNYFVNEAVTAVSLVQTFYDELIGISE